MPELFTVRTPPEAWTLFLEHFSPVITTERIATADALDRVLTEQLNSAQDLPNFRRSTVDGYAVIAADTYGATPGLPAFLTVAGEVSMTVLILDNETVAMTGGQATILPSSRLEPLIRGLGIDESHIRTIVPLRKNMEDNVRILREEIEYDGLSVILSFRECIETAKRKRKGGK